MGHGPGPRAHGPPLGWGVGGGGGSGSPWANEVLGLWAHELIYVYNHVFGRFRVDVGPIWGRFRVDFHMILRRFWVGLVVDLGGYFDVNSVLVGPKRLPSLRIKRLPAGSTSNLLAGSRTASAMV